MNIKSIKLIYFSPTKTTERILAGISKGIQADKEELLDLTPPKIKIPEFAVINDDFVIIGAPVYGGRVANEAAIRLSQLKADKTPAAIIVLYGNRAYEDALLELKDLTIQAGFIPVAGGAFIGEHSFANETTPIACDRPDVADLEKAKEFGTLIRAKIRDINNSGEIPALQVPGNFPYKERRQRQRSKISPTTKEDLCTLCGTCASVCPTGSIRVNNMVETDPNGCIFCCACIKNCPVQARVNEAPSKLETAERLSKKFQERKEPDIFV